MTKYWSIFKISIHQEFAYKLNFLMWRVRNVFQIVVTFFLWTTIYGDQNQIFFGYDKAKILSYMFLVMIVRALVLSARSSDVSNDVSQGNLSNHLLKPFSYFSYWVTRDIASKVLNLIFASIEFTILVILLKPSLYFQADIYTLVSFVIAIIIAMMLYFFLLFIISAVPFWAPELGWGAQFLVSIIIIEFLSGALFPIDILPNAIQRVVMVTPFPYLLFFPIEVYLGKITGAPLVEGFLISIVWTIILYFCMNFIWRRGLKIYQATGR